MKNRKNINIQYGDEVITRSIEADVCCVHIDQNCFEKHKGRRNTDVVLFRNNGKKDTCGNELWTVN